MVNCLCRTCHLFFGHALFPAKLQGFSKCRSSLHGELFFLLGCKERHCDDSMYLHFGLSNILMVGAILRNDL